MSFLQELRRRKVFRLAALYIVGAWVVLQVADLAFESWDIASSALRYVWLGAILGFPIALVFGWRYDITAHGIVRTPPTSASTQLDLSLHRSDYFILPLLVVVAIGVIYPLTVQIRDSQTPQQLEVAQRHIELNAIAVLPFSDMSEIKNQEYFADGLSDTLIHVLAQVSGLKVTAKTSSFYFKGKNIDVREIARELNVGTILEGSVRKAGNKIRVTTQLVNAEDGVQLWSRSFDRDLKDIFAVQDEIAQQVVQALEVTLLGKEQERLAQRRHPNLEAYGQLILGRHEMAKRTAVGLAAAELHFNEAIKLDPDYALAYVSLADNYALQEVNADLTPEESLERRQPLIEKALELDPLSAEVYTSRALALEEQFEFEAAEENFLKAIELNPSYATAPQWYSILLQRLGRFEEALAQIRVAAELDPMSPIIQVSVASSVWNTGRVEEALTLLRHNIERNPELHVNYLSMADYQSVLGHLGVAQRWHQEAHKRNPEGARLWMNKCLGFLHLGDTLSAEDCVNQLSEAHPESHTSFYAWHQLQMYRGEWNAAISTLEYMLERQTKRSDETWRLADVIARQGDVELARRVMVDAFPELLEDELELTVTNLQVALTFAAILHANDEMWRRDVLLLAIEEQIATMHRNRGYGYGILDVYIHAMRGDRDRAIAALREAIDVGWLVSGLSPYGLKEDACWWMLRQDWKLGSLGRDSEFIGMMDALEADIAVQRQWYEENKGKPLL